MTFSYRQVSQYLRCPRSYRFRYLDGWREKDSRAALCFGRCFEKAIAALFEREDAGAVLFKEWGTYPICSDAGRNSGALQNRLKVKKRKKNLLKIKFVKHIVHYH